MSKLTIPIQTKKLAEKPLNEKQIDALIGQGGSSVASDKKASNDDEKLQVRIITYKSQMHEIEEIISQMPKRGRPSRHAWILQAIDEKLERAKRKRP